MLVALRYRDYRFFWVGNAASNIGIWMLFAGRLWLMHELTDSKLMLGVLTFAAGAPMLVLSMWGGVVADRVNRVRLVTFTRAMFSVTALLTWGLIAYDVIQPWHLLAIALVNAVLLSFDMPSRHAIIPNLVPKEHLVNAISLQSFLGTGSSVLGPAIFAPMVRLWNIEGVFLFVGVAYALTAVMFAQVTPQPIARTDSRTAKPWSDLMAGFSYIKARGVIVTLIAIAVVTGILGSSFGTLLPVFADDILGGDVQSYSFLLMSGGVGGMSGALLLAVFGNLKNSASVQVLTGVGFGVGLAAFAGVSWLPLAVAIIGIVSALSTAFGTINSTLMQSSIDDEFRGRVMSVHQLGWGASAIGGLLVGILAEAFGAPFALALCGGTMAVAVGALSLSISRSLSERAKSAAQV